MFTFIVCSVAASADGHGETLFPLFQIVSDGSHKQGPHGKLVWTTSGRVETDPTEPDYIDATADTNNTGELSVELSCLLCSGSCLPSRAPHTSAVCYSCVLLKLIDMSALRSKCHLVPNVRTRNELNSKR